MAENSNIEWTDHTFSPWVGCTKISPACDHCYAETWAKRSGHPELWTGSRRRTSPANWRKPRIWEKKAKVFFAEHGRRQRVFCASLADVFDNDVPHEWRADLWELIAATPSLDWLLLTKRIGNAPSMLPADWAGWAEHGAAYPNVWIGATVVTQAEYERDVGKLLALPAAVRFLSMEPLIEAVDLDPKGLDWIIVGGESGAHARPLEQDWCESIAGQCREAGVPFFMKQGSRANWRGWKDFASWPLSLRVREFPVARQGP